MSRRLFAVAIGIAFAMSATSADAKSRSRKHHVKASHSHHYQQGRHHHARYASLRRHLRHGVRGASANRGCLVPAARALLARIESQFGPVQVISTCRPGAVIAGSGHPSLHRNGMAFDFRTSSKAAVVRWLAQHNSGGTMTYSHSDHIHADVGRYHFVSLGGQRRLARAHRHGHQAFASQVTESGSSFSNAAGDWPGVEPQHAMRRAQHARRHGSHMPTL